ncbi:MAG: hypothetical protein JWO36_799 [Myxococcales bacterium]|nr:hypothetical protein [Myxococcales bacterium]
MRVECGSCHELAVATFAITGGEIVATCSACQSITRVSSNAPDAVSTAPADVSSTPLCPKCGAPRTPAAACQSCGLATDKMEAFTQARDAAVPDSVRAAWGRVEDAWTEPARHDELLRLVSQHSAYAWAAGRYRDAIRQRTGDTIGGGQLERVRRAAEAQLLATATGRPDLAKKALVRTIGVLVTLVLIVAAWLVYSIVREDAPPPRPTVRQPRLP